MIEVIIAMIGLALVLGSFGRFILDLDWFGVVLGVGISEVVFVASYLYTRYHQNYRR